MLSRALIVDSDEIARNVMSRTLHDYGIRSVATASELRAAKARLDDEVDLLITSVHIAGESCVPLVDEMRARSRVPHIIVVSDSAPRSLVFRLAKLPEVSAYLEKPVASRVLWRCLDALGTGDGQPHVGGPRWSSAGHPLQLDHRLIEYAVERYRSTCQLTNAELEILRCAVSGMRRGEIALERGVSMNTLKTQVRSLLWKCGASALESLAAQLRRDLRPYGT